MNGNRDARGRKPGILLPNKFTEGARIFASTEAKTEFARANCFSCHKVRTCKAFIAIAGNVHYYNHDYNTCQTLGCKPVVVEKGELKLRIIMLRNRNIAKCASFEERLI